MIRINEIKDAKLRELAYQRTLEDADLSDERLEFLKGTNEKLNGCFVFAGTEEGHDFWERVGVGEITTLEPTITAEQFFIQEWGTGFIKATLHDPNGLLELSMEDIYKTMEDYKNQ